MKLLGKTYFILPAIRMLKFQDHKIMADQWFVYMAQCRDNSLYTGITKNLEKRISQHNSGTGAKYTKARRPVRLVYFEQKSTRSEASKREYEIKGLSRSQKRELIR